MDLQINLQELFNALEQASRAPLVHIPGGKQQAYLISEGDMAAIKKLAELVNGSPYTFQGGEKKRTETPDEMYVVVNLASHPWWATNDHWIMGEEPHTCSSLDDAAWLVADVMAEHPIHTPETLHVFRLLPVGVAPLEEALKRLEREEDEVLWPQKPEAVYIIHNQDGGVLAVISDLGDRATARAVFDWISNGHYAERHPFGSENHDAALEQLGNK